MEANREPYTLEETVRFLKHHQYINKLLFIQMSGLLPAVPDWRIKQALGLHQWQLSIQTNELRSRLKELRVPRPDKGLDDLASMIRGCLDTAPNARAMLKALYFSVVSRLTDVFERQAERTYRVNDAPTLRLLGKMRDENREQLDNMKSLISSSDEYGTDDKGGADWFAAFDGEIAGLLDNLYFHGSAVRSDAALAKLRALGTGQPILPSPKAVRPKSFKVGNVISLPAGNDRNEELKFQFGNYVQEMQAAETVGSCMYEIPDMPWEFYYDLSRHLWDEIRHSTMGQVRLQEIGIELDELVFNTANYEWRQNVDPVRRYMILTYVIEAPGFPLKNMRYKGHMEAGDFISAQALLYDITDETMHVQFGYKWVPELLDKYGLGSVEAVFAECERINDENTIVPLQKSSYLKQLG